MAGCCLHTELDNDAAVSDVSVGRRARLFFGTFGATLAFLLSLVAWWIYWSIGRCLTKTWRAAAQPPVFRPSRGPRDSFFPQARCFRAEIKF